MKFVVERKGEGRKPQVEQAVAFRNFSATTLISKVGGRKLQPGLSEYGQASGAVVACSPTFGLGKLYRRQG